MMNTRVALFLTYLALFFFCSAHAATITFKNKCPYTVWPGTLGADQKAQLSTTGFTLGGGATKTVKVPSPWLGLFWARTGCSSESGKFMCETADCGSGQVECNGAGAVPPATLIELRVAANKGKDYYVVSNVEGFNVPVSIAPHGGTGHCKASSCPANINSACPAKLQVKGSGGMVIACKSACLAFNQPKYCCTEDYSRAGKCRATNYSKFFEKQCPDAYNYANDKNSIFTCSGGPNYTITFCPAA